MNKEEIITTETATSTGAGLDLVVILNPVYDITENIDGIKEELSHKLAVYRNLHYSNEQSGLLAKDLAKLRKLLKAIKDKRDEIQREILEAGYIEFAAKAKSLEMMISEVILTLSEQQDKQEEERIQAKHIDITLIYEELFIGYLDTCSLDNIARKEWKNKGSTLKMITAEIASKREEFSICLKYIEGMKEEEKARLLSIATQTFSIADVLKENEKIEEERLKAAKIIEALEEQKRIKLEVELEDKAKILAMKEELDLILRNSVEQEPIVYVAPLEPLVPIEGKSLVETAISVVAEEPIIVESTEEEDMHIYTCNFLIIGSKKTKIVKDLLLSLGIEHTIETL